MPPKAQKQILFPVTSPEQFMEITAPENPRLVIIDCHLAWCGPCGIMEQNYRAMYFNFENADQRIAFYTCTEDNVPQEVAAAYKHGPLTCKPRFLIYAVSYHFSVEILTAGGREEGRGIWS